jgi:hypothetical protein
MTTGRLVTLPVALYRMSPLGIAEERRGRLVAAEILNRAGVVASGNARHLDEADEESLGIGRGQPLHERRAFLLPGVKNRDGVGQGPHHAEGVHDRLAFGRRHFHRPGAQRIEIGLARRVDRPLRLHDGSHPDRDERDREEDRDLDQKARPALGGREGRGRLGCHRVFSLYRLSSCGRHPALGLRAMTASVA